MLRAGARCLEHLLAGLGRGRGQRPVCAHNHPPTLMDSRGQRVKPLTTILGAVALRRSVFVCRVCGRRRAPGDEALGVVGEEFSPGARRMMSRAAAEQCFFGGAEDLRLFAGLDVNAKDIERAAKRVGRLVDVWMARQASTAVLCGGPRAPIHTLYVSYDGTGVPMRRVDLEGRRGKGPDGRAKTREAKIGCVFTQTSLDEQGRPARDPDSTTYVGAIETSRDFGYRIHAEAVRRGLNHAQRVALLIDAQTYNKTIAQEHFPNATVINDLCHARGHLASFARETGGGAINDPLPLPWMELLDAGDVEALTTQMRHALPRSGPRRDKGLGQIAYFLNNADAMRYDRFRKMGLFVGSGVVEAGCRTLIGQRLKHSGMFWSLPGANAIIALRCCIESRRFNDFWESLA